MEPQLTRSVAAPMGGRGLRTDGGADYTFWPLQDAGGQARVVHVSGMLSAAFGAWQLIAPRQFARTVGMSYPDWLLRAVGACDLAVGVAILARPESRNWRRARFVNDLLDTGLIGAAAFAPRTNRRRLAAFAALAAGVIALDARAARAGAPE
jgi:uncharacterized protein YjeT (DUF2065 family)